MLRYVEPIQLPAASGVIYGGAGQLMGWALHNTSLANAAHVRLWDSTSAAGKLVVPISLTADQSTRDGLWARGLLLEQGVFYELVDGAVEGAIWIGPLGDEDASRPWLG